jgi:hypothetical protein
MLPFDVKLSSKINVACATNNIQNDLLEYFKNEIINKKANNVEIINDSVNFKNELSHRLKNKGILFYVDSGRIKVEQSGSTEFKVEYSLVYKLVFFYGLAVFSLFYLISSHLYWCLFVGIFIGFGNWIFSIITNYFTFKKLCKNYDPRLSQIKKYF